MTDNHSAMPPLHVIRYSATPWQCWDARRRIQAHLQRDRARRVLAAACARPVLLPVPAVKWSPGR